MAKKREKMRARKTAVRKTRGSGVEAHLGATEEQVGDRTGSGAGYDQKERSKQKPAKGGVST
jgi:hypothetical protein